MHEMRHQVEVVFAIMCVAYQIRSISVLVSTVTVTVQLH